MLAGTLMASGAGMERPAGCASETDFLVPVAICEGAHGVTEMAQTTALQGVGGKAGQGYQAIRTGSMVRRLTPLECERLQGFSDNATLVDYKGKPAADAHRYKAIGNSMAVPCMAWIGKRIDEVEAL